MPGAVQTLSFVPRGNAAIKGAVAGSVPRRSRATPISSLTLSRHVGSQVAGAPGRCRHCPRRRPETRAGRPGRSSRRSRRPRCGSISSTARIRSSCLTRVVVRRAVRVTRLLTLKRPVQVSRRPSTVPPSIGRAARVVPRLAEDGPVCDSCRSCFRKSAAHASAPRAISSDWSSANSVHCGAGRARRGS